MRILPVLAGPCVLACVCASFPAAEGGPRTQRAASSAGEETFLSQKEEIRTLALERTRTAHFDYQRTLKMVEHRLRRLHENYMVAGSTPPTKLDEDVKKIQNGIQRLRLRRARGRQFPPEPAVEGSGTAPAFSYSTPFWMTMVASPPSSTS